MMKMIMLMMMMMIMTMILIMLMAGLLRGEFCQHTQTRLTQLSQELQQDEGRRGEHHGNNDNDNDDDDDDDDDVAR